MYVSFQVRRRYLKRHRPYRRQHQERWPHAHRRYGACHWAGAGAGVPHDAPASGGTLFGLTDKEVEQMNNFKLLVIHLGGVKNHITYKARLILRNLNKHCIIICESPADEEDFAKIGIKTSKVMPAEENIKTLGTIDDIVTGVIRGETVSQEKLDEIIRKTKLALGDA